LKIALMKYYTRGTLCHNIRR